MAACYAALEPPAELWNDYINEIDKLQSLGTISADDHQLLRYSQPARTALMNLTGGVEQAFSSRTIHEILARMKADVKAEVLSEHEVLLEENRAKLDGATQAQVLAKVQFEAATADAERSRLRADAEVEPVDVLLRELPVVGGPSATGQNRNVGICGPVTSANFRAVESRMLEIRPELARPPRLERGTPSLLS
jgi:hypothetical protein